MKSILDSKYFWKAVDDWNEEELENCDEEKHKNKEALVFIKKSDEDIHLENIDPLKKAWEILKEAFVSRNEALMGMKKNK